MQTIYNTYAELYAWDTTLDNQIINKNYVSTPINDDVPSEDEIRWATNQLKRWKAPGPSELRAEDIQK
jgi:hypothetical protein